MTLLHPDDLLRLVKGLVADELTTTRRTRPSAESVAAWNETTRLDDAGLGLDSLELLACAGRLNQFFHLHEFGAEDYLLRDRWLGAWVELVASSRDHFDAAFTFQTSGSTGRPKAFTHASTDLLQEVGFVATLFTDRRRIVGLVPCQHLYGFLFTILLPRILDVPFLDARTLSPGKLKRELAADDLVVGFPTIWSYVASSIDRLPAGIAGTSSTAPLATDLEERLRAQGLQRLVEIYGATDLGGIGTRERGSDPFTLMPHWSLADDGSHLLRRRADLAEAVAVLPPDHLAWTGERTFRPRGRRDEAVQIGGINVFPGRIAQVLGMHAAVGEAVVRAVPAGAELALEALVVPVDPAMPAETELAAELRRHCRERLLPEERPRRIEIVDALPRNELGKVTT